MDRVVAIIVWALSAIGGWARVLPGIDYASWEPGQKVKVLLAGYNGARNTGSDVRVSAIAEQLRKRLGDAVEISVMSLDVSSTAPYFDASVRQIPFNTVFFGALYRACSEHHVVILCEGSTLKSKFANAVTLYNCEAAGVARAQGKPCIAYGSEIGEMDAFVAAAARGLCSDVQFIVRSAGSLEALQSMGLDGRLGTDTAWHFDSSGAHEQAMALLRAGGWDGETPLLGIAPVNPYCWPVKPSIRRFVQSAITGDWSGHYQAWYYFSQSAQRERKFQAYLEALAGACLTFALERGFQPVIFGMEQLDQEACLRLNDLMGGSVPLVLSNEHNGYVIAAALRSLSLLATSRYHAQVLATRALVPAVAVSMDERLDNLSRELGTGRDQLLHVDDADLAPRLLLALDDTWADAARIKETLAQGLEAAEASLDAMDEWLATTLGAAAMRLT